MSLCSPSDGKCGEKILLTPATRAHAQQVGRSPIARQSVKVFAFYIYLVQPAVAISGVSGLGANLYAKKRKMTILNFEKSLHGEILIQLTVDYKFVRTGTLLCDKNIYSALPYCVVLLLSKNKLSSTINNFLGW